MQALPRLRTREADTTSYVADYLTRSVRRASGFVLADDPERIACGSDLPDGTITTEDEWGERRILSRGHW